MTNANRTGTTMTATTATTAPTSSTMQAMVQAEYGGPEVLDFQQINRPTITDEQVLIRVRAAGVNPADWAIMSGLPYIARPVYGFGQPKNQVRGTDVSGHVEAVGAAVTGFQPGDEVFGFCDGSYAEYAAASEKSLSLKPSNLTFEQAAAVPMAALVAFQAVAQHGNVQTGQKVLVNGASGGVGTFAVQIAKSLGAHVTGVCSGRNADLVRSVGADQVIDYTKDDFTRSAQRYDYILDNVANHSLSDLRRVLTPSGTLVPNGGEFDNLWFAGAGRVVATRLLQPFVKHNLRPFLLSMNTEDLVAVTELIEAGKMMPVIDRTYSLVDVPQAIGYVGEGHARGKVVITL